MTSRGARGASPSLGRLVTHSYTLSLWLSLALCLAHMFSLPIVITFDGYWYAKLADSMGAGGLGENWDYLRTPLFPALLKASFWILGRQPLAIIALQTALAFGGIWLIGATIRRFRPPLE